MASLVALLLLTFGVSAYGVAQASAAELPSFDVAPATVAAPHAAVGSEPAQWRAVFDDGSVCEFPGLEPETNEDPVGPGAPSVLRPQFSCTATIRSADQTLQAASVNYTARLVASPVLARAPPRVAC